MKWGWPVNRSLSNFSSKRLHTFASLICYIFCSLLLSLLYFTYKSFTHPEFCGSTCSIIWNTLAHIRRRRLCTGLVSINNTLLVIYWPPFSIATENTKKFYFFLLLIFIVFLSKLERAWHNIFSQREFFFSLALS
jgi:hypothetical protein